MDGEALPFDVSHFSRRDVRRVPRDSRLGIHEEGRICQGEDSGHTDQSLFLQQVLLFLQWSGGREMSSQSRNPSHSELDGPGDQGLLLLSFITRGGSSERLRGGGECKNTRDVHKFLNSGAYTKEEIGVCRGMLSSRCKESVGDGVSGESQDTRCQGIRVDVWNRAPLGHRPC